MLQAAGATAGCPASAWMHAGKKGRPRIAGPSWRGRGGSRKAPPASRCRLLEADFAGEGDGVDVEVDAIDVGLAAVVVQAQAPAAAEVVAGGHADVRLDRALVVDDVEVVFAQLQGHAGQAGAGADEEAGVVRTEVVLGHDAGTEGDQVHV